MLSLKNKLAKYYINLRGWKTKRKIIVIESDDWGSIRMPSRIVVDLLKGKKHPLEISKFTLLDGLERQSDLDELFKVLESHKDKVGHHPVITACALVANPDFDKIKASNFKEYFVETIEETYKYYGEIDLLSFWLEKGIKKNLLYPQFHGREHLNPAKWLKVLKSDNVMEKDAFENKTLLGLSGVQTSRKDSYMSAFRGVSKKEKNDINQITKEGLKLFEEIFGFKSISFIPSQSIQFEEINKILVAGGVEFSQAGQYFIPNEEGELKKVNKLWGDKDKYGMTYWRRNCRFEPFKDDENEIDNCLEEIEIAFKCGKPAVISSHRINFTSRIDGEHRDLSLEKLNKLLEAILKKWPDVEFMNSETLSKTLMAE
jgi:hypothetical protein